MAKQRKKKKKQRNPKLSKTDKTLYYILYALVIAVPVMLLMLIYLIKSKIVFSDKNVIAYHSTSDFWFLPLVFAIFSLIIPLTSAFYDRKPILHRKKIKKNECKKTSAALIFVYIALCIAMCIPAVGALYSRTQITPQSLGVYSMFGKFKGEIPVSSAQSADIKITGPGRYAHWSILYKIKFDNGKTYSFNVNPNEAIELYYLLSDVKMNFDGNKHVDIYCESKHCSDEQTAVLYEMFGGN